MYNYVYTYSTTLFHHYGACIVLICVSKYIVSSFHRFQKLMLLLLKVL